MPKCPKCHKEISHLHCHAVTEEDGSYFPDGCFDPDGGGSIQYSSFSCPHCGKGVGALDQDAAEVFLAGE